MIRIFQMDFKMFYEEQIGQLDQSVEREEGYEDSCDESTV